VKCAGSRVCNQRGSWSLGEVATGLGLAGLLGTAWTGFGDALCMGCGSVVVGVGTACCGVSWSGAFGTAACRRGLLFLVAGGPSGVALSAIAGRASAAIGVAAAEPAARGAGAAAAAGINGGAGEHSGAATTLTGAIACCTRLPMTPIAVT
jgi:hypothetical protein